MGNGQYYDPSTGRFLTRGAQQDQSNPYTPWNSDPAGMLIAPLALLALVFGRKKTRTKFDQFVILFVIVVSVGLSVSACNITDDNQNVDIVIVVTPITDRARSRDDLDKNQPLPGLHYSEAARYIRKISSGVNVVISASTLECINLPTEGPDPMEGGYWYENDNLRILYDIYVRMYNEDHENWWWKEYGSSEDDQHFSLKDFYKVLAVREVAHAPTFMNETNLNYYVEAIARKSQVYCKDSRFFADANQGCDPSTNDGAAHFIYWWSVQARRKVTKCQTNCNLADEFANTYPLYLEWPEKVIDAIMENDISFLPIVNDRPFDTGNIVSDGEKGITVSEYGRFEAEFGTPLYISPYIEAQGNNVNRLVVLTFCEWAKIEGSGLYNQERCDLDMPRQGQEVKEGALQGEILGYGRPYIIR